MNDNILTVEIGYCQISTFGRTSIQRTSPAHPAHAGRLTVSAIVLPCRLRWFPW